MTCIVGIIEKNKVYMGADSAGVGGYDIIIRKDKKIFKIGDFLIGCTGSFRMIQLIQYSFKPPKVPRNKDIYEYMCTQFINSLRQIFKKGGFMEITNSKESGGTFLVAYKNRLFTIYSDFQVSEALESYASLGCGYSFALGALDALDSKMNVKDKINKSLEVAVYRSAGVRPPFIILST
jgi:ATP-dependent protease HslVU (ClpYQ) peptidase subunit